MINNKLIYIISMALTLVGCNTNARDAIYNACITECKDGDHCRINLKTDLPFKWDRMLLIREVKSDKDMQKRFHVSVPDGEDWDTEGQIVFMLGKDIVCQDKYPFEYEDGEPIKVLFSTCASVADTNRCIYTPQDAIFDVEKRGYNKGMYYYYLIPANQ